MLSDEQLDKLALLETYKAGARSNAQEMGIPYEDSFDEATAQNENQMRDMVPLAADMVRFVLYLRNNTDFFSGPELDIHFPDVTDPAFMDVLTDHAIQWTGE